MTTIPLPWPKPPITGNRHRNNEHAYAAKVRQAQTEARWSIRAAKVTPLDRAEAVLHWRIPNRIRRDADNMLGTLKVVLDAAVLEGVLPDDGWQHVPAAGCRIHPPTGEPAAMWLTLEVAP